MAVTLKRAVNNGVMLCMICAFSVVCLLKKIFSPFFRFFFAKRLPKVLRTPEERFNGLDVLGYTFKPNYVHFPAGGGKFLPRVHYIDAGRTDGPVIMCLHGEPTWSFLYRKMINVFVGAGYRVIAPDFIGFGKSDKYSGQVNYNQELHCSTVRLLIDHLKLEDITLVVQDWGGLTGLTVLGDIPDKFKNVVILNTFLPTGFDLASIKTKFTNIVSFLMWRMMVDAFGQHLPINFVMNKLGKIPAAAIVGYVAPFPDSQYFAGGAIWPLLVPLFRDDPVIPDMMAARQGLSEWKKPCLVMFSDRDSIMRGFDEEFLQMVPHAKHATVSGAGHFLQETHGEECAKNVVDFLKGGL